MAYLKTTYDGDDRYYIEFYTTNEDNIELVESICKEIVKEKYSSFSTSYACGNYGIEFRTAKKETFFEVQDRCRKLVDSEKEKEEEKNNRKGEELRRKIHSIENAEEEMCPCRDDCDEETETCEEGNSCDTCMYRGSHTDDCLCCVDFSNYADEPLIKYAKNELNRITHDEYQERINRDVLELIKVISRQGHSGFSVNCVLNCFNRLARFKPLSPLTDEDNEWEEVTSGEYQNKRCSSVFKDKDGKAFNIEGKVFSDDDGKTWFQNGQSRIEVTFPYTVPDEPEKVILVPKEEK